MSISRKQFFEETWNRKGKINNPNNEETTQDKVLKFLQKNDKGFKTVEIQKQLKLSYWAVIGALRKLAKIKKVIHKEPYFILNISRHKKNDYK